MKKNKFLAIALTALLFTSCGDYNKVLMSSDNEFKYKRAVEYYNSKDFTKSSQILNDLVRVYNGTSKADDVYYYLAKSYMGQKDYLSAGTYFKRLVKEYPRSEFAEESQFMVGYCFYLDSPKPRLDQTVTEQGIDALQLFINLFPSSSRVEEATRLIDEMRDKMAYKAFLNAKLYYDLGYYKSSVVALTNCIKDFPETKYREELMFMLLKSKFLLAVNSIEDKKRERASTALDEYYTFIDEFPKSQNRKEAERLFNELSKMNKTEDKNAQ
ncbi:MAG: outer membrane protein assembly factor BamD [Bacteroidota bacterium]|nr:outer membrane protein assembly factor BamD [Bacteroidota bacterium]MDP4204502.1 outer membrane protein assembly factor BamD [Bacteroidota bacterium]